MSRRTTADSLPTPRDQRDRLRALLEAISQGIQENDLEGTITFSNAAHARMLGYAPGELVGRKIWDFLESPAERAELEAYLGYLVAEQPEPEPYPSRSLREDGARVDLRIDWAYRRDESGRLVGFTSVITDVTEQLRSQRAARRATERYRQLFEEAPVMYLITRERDGQAAIEDCNLRFVETLGYRKEELVGRPLDELYTLDSLRAYREGGYASALAGVFRSEERQLRTRTGEVVDTLLSAVPERDAAGMVVGTRAMYLDITEQRLLERELRQSQKMEALGRLAGGIAHDFNNLLTGILGYCDLLRLGSDLDADQRHGLDQIRQAGTKAAGLTHQLLGFTRQRAPMPTVLDLNTVVSEIATLLRRTIGEDVELVTRLDPTLPPIRADRGQIEQVLLNLAVNARDAMPDGGVLEIITGDAGVTGDPSPLATRRPSARLSVRDTGLGMGAETRERVFEPFFTTKPEGQGTGLGLATVYGIVRQCDGEISVESEPGQGARFDLRFPAAASGEEDAAAPSPPPALGTEKATILLVEDEPAVRALTARLLGREGHEVLEAGTPEAALELCRAQGERIDLLLTDLRLPQFSGRRLAARVRELVPGVRVLLMSGFEEREGDGPLGELPFLQKPFGADTLLAAVRDVLEGDRAT